MATSAKRKAKPVANLPAKQKRPGTAVMIRQAENTPKSATGIMLDLAKDKNFDAAKFQVMAEFNRNMIAQQALLNYFQDFHLMQEQLPSIARDGKIVIRDKNNEAVIKQKTQFATLPNIMNVCKPILQRNNFTLHFTEQTEPDGRPTTTGVLVNNRGGYLQTSTLTLQVDATGSKNNVQGVGSAISYARRYITIGLLNLISHAVEDIDDDGTVAGDANMQPISDEQFSELEKKIKEVGADRMKFRHHFNLESIRALPQKDFKAAMNMLDQKAAKKAAP